MNLTTVVPSPSQVALDLVCALIAGGYIRFGSENPETVIQEAAELFTRTNKKLSSTSTVVRPG